MLISPQQRRYGLGTDFYKTFEHCLVAQNVNYISLCAIAVNEPGLQFWQSVGFETTQLIPSKPYGQKTHDVIVLRRALQP